MHCDGTVRNKYPCIASVQDVDNIAGTETITITFNHLLQGLGTGITLFN